MDLRAVPRSAPSRQDPIAIKTLGNPAFAGARCALVEDTPHRGRFFFIARCERHSLVLDALALPALQHPHRIAGFIQKEPLIAERRPATGPIALPSDRGAAVKDLG